MYRTDLDAPAGMGLDDKAIATAEAVVRRGFMRKVFGILSLQMLMTTVVVGICMSTLTYAGGRATNESIARASVWVQPLLIVSAIGSIALLCVMSCCRNFARQYPTNYALLFGFTAFESILVAAICMASQPVAVLMAAGLTTILCLGLTAYALKTDVDHTGKGMYLFAGLIVLVGGSIMLGVVGFIMGGSPRILHDLLSVGFVFLFAMYLVYDVQRIMLGKHQNTFTVDDHCFAALSIYMDIINIFIHILSLLRER